MAIALDKTATLVSKAGTAGRTLSITFPSTPTVGSLVLVPIFMWVNDVGPTNYFQSVTDNQGNTYNSIQVASGALNQAQCHLGYGLANVSSGTFTVTFTFTSAPDPLQVYLWLGAFAFTGCTGAVDQQATGTVPHDSLTLDLTTPTTTIVDALLFACVNVAANNSNLNIVQTVGGYTNPTGYLVNDGVTVTGMRVDYAINSGIGTKQTTWTFNAAHAAGMIVTFPAVAGNPTLAGSAGTGGSGTQTPAMSIPL